MKKKTPHIVLFITLFLTIICFTACVSSYTALQEIEPGLTKPEVRIELGKPKSVGRTKGRDRWTYKFKKNSQEYTQDVFFEDGLLIKVGPLTPYPNYKKKMVEAETLEDYEIHASLYQKQKSKGFREINSVKKNDLREFCSRLFSKPEKKTECENNMKGKKFLYSALLFCKKEIKGYRAKLSCLSETANKTFPLSALEFCASTKTFSKSSIQKLQCLRNSRSHSLPKNKETETGNIICDLNQINTRSYFSSGCSSSAD